MAWPGLSWFDLEFFLGWDSFLDGLAGKGIAVKAQLWFSRAHYHGRFMEIKIGSLPQITTLLSHPNTGQWRSGLDVPGVVAKLQPKTGGSQSTRKQRRPAALQKQKNNTALLQICLQGLWLSLSHEYDLILLFEFERAVVFFLAFYHKFVGPSLHSKWAGLKNQTSKASWSFLIRISCQIQQLNACTFP